MFKLPHYLLMLAFIPSILFAQSKKEVQKYKIKSVTEWTTIYKDGKETPAYKSEFTAFNKEGKTTETTQFNPDGSVKRKETTTYDKNDNKIEETKLDNDQQKEKGTKKITYTYNKNNEKTEEIHYLENKMIKKSVYIYNPLGEKITELNFDETFHLIKKHTYKYSAQSLKIEIKILNGQDVLESVKKYVYEF